MRTGAGGLLQLGQPPQGPQACLPQLGYPLMDLVFLRGRGQLTVRNCVPTGEIYYVAVSAAKGRLGPEVGRTGR